jgi:hypothetical protein
MVAASGDDAVGACQFRELEEGHAQGTCGAKNQDAFAVMKVGVA